MIHIACPSCKKVHKADESLIGKRVKCSDCGATFEVVRNELQPVQQPNAKKVDNPGAGTVKLTTGPATDNPRAIQSRKRNHMNIIDFLTFRRMITPIIIQIIFWIGVALCVIGGLISIVTGASSDFGGGAQVLSGLLVIFLGPVITRVYCELLILMFRMNETLTDIRRNTEKP